MERSVLKRQGRRTGQSARTLLWVAASLVIVGAAVGSPAGATVATALAALCALVPIAVGSPQWRIIGLIVLGVSVLLTIINAPNAQQELRMYREQALRGHPREPATPRQSP
jgi:hypothetical protein